TLEQGNVHVPLTSFVGRDGDVSAVIADLQRARLVTLIGPGGVGKTRLATETARDLRASFPDGCWVFALAPASDNDTVERVVGGVLGVRQRAGLSTQESR